MQEGSGPGDQRLKVRMWRRGRKEYKRYAMYRNMVTLMNVNICHKHEIRLIIMGKGDLDNDIGSQKGLGRGIKIEPSYVMYQNPHSMMIVTYIYCKHAKKTRVIEHFMFWGLLTKTVT